MKTDNELIAEFMGLENEIVGINRMYSHVDIDGNDWSYTEEELMFYKSWDWLMPVVEKIHKMDKMVCINFYTESYTIVTKVYSWGLGDDLHEAEFENKSAIVSVYQAVVNFIKWHNTQK